MNTKLLLQAYHFAKKVSIKQNEKVNEIIKKRLKSLLLYTPIN